MRPFRFDLPDNSGDQRSFLIDSGFRMERKNLQYRHVRAHSIILAQDLPVAMKNLLADRCYRVKDIANMPVENIRQYIALHPPVVFKNDTLFHAIGNLRSLELLGYLQTAERVPVLQLRKIPRKKIAETAIAWEFGKTTFDALEPLQFEQTVLALWDLYHTQQNCPPVIHTKIGLAKFLSINRRKLSKSVPDQIEPSFLNQEID